MSAKIAARLASLKVAELKLLCKDSGLTGIPTRKAEVINSLANHLVGAPHRPRRVLSIDVGYRNLAWACVDGNHLLGWRRETLIGTDAVIKEDVAESDRIYDPAVFAANVHRVVANMEGAVRAKVPSAPACGAAQDHIGGLAVVIERQRMLPGQSGFTVFMVNSVEGMLWSAFLHPSFIHRHNHPTMFSLPPGQVSKWFEHGGAGKKNAATLLAQLLLSSPTHAVLLDKSSDSTPPPASRPNQLRVPRLYATQFGMEKKKDDMADALLQALAYQDWRANGSHFAKELESGIPNFERLAAKEGRPFNWRSALTGRPCVT